MQVEAVKRFLRALGADQLDTREHWVNCRCLMAPYTHAGGVDSAPSFGVSISPDGGSVYYCFGCTQTAKPLQWILHNIFVMTGRYPWEAARIFRKEENHGRSSKKIEIPDVWSASRVITEPLPYQVLRKFPLLQASSGFESRRCHEWLEDARNIPVWTQHLCRVRYWDDASSLVFPLTDIKGNVFLLRTRSRKKKYIRTVNAQMAGVDVDFPKLTAAGAWFGMFLIDWSRPVMLVEAEIDALRIISLGFFNVIASATSNVTDAQIDALHTDVLLLGYDDDSAGEHAHMRIIDRVGEKASMFKLKWGLVKNSKGEPCKDGGDLMTPDDLKTVLLSRSPVKN